jgi:hypothetical protein
MRSRAGPRGRELRRRMTRLLRYEPGHSSRMDETGSSSVPIGQMQYVWNGISVDNVQYARFPRLFTSCVISTRCLHSNQVPRLPLSLRVNQVRSWARTFSYYALVSALQCPCFPLFEFGDRPVVAFATLQVDQNARHCQYPFRRR